MDIGTEKAPYVVEPLVDPVPREHDEPERPAPSPAPTPEQVPA